MKSIFLQGNQKKQNLELDLVLEVRIGRAPILYKQMDPQMTVMMTRKNLHKKSHH
jgi:hypothetical protein